MASTLRVDPSRLVAAASAEGEVGAFVAAMGAGRSLAEGAAAMSQLRSGAVLHYAASTIDEAAAALHHGLTEHSAKLTAAADLYRHADERLGRRLGEIAETI